MSRSNLQSAGEKTDNFYHTCMQCFQLSDRILNSGDSVFFLYEGLHFRTFIFKEGDNFSQFIGCSLRFNRDEEVNEYRYQNESECTFKH